MEVIVWKDLYLAVHPWGVGNSPSNQRVRVLETKEFDFYAISNGTVIRRRKKDGNEMPVKVNVSRHGSKTVHFCSSFISSLKMVMAHAFFTSFWADTPDRVVFLNGDRRDCRPDNLGIVIGTRR